MISSIEKSVLISKYKKEGLSFEEVKNRIKQLITFTNKRHKKQEKDFNEEFKKLWSSGM